MAAWTQQIDNDHFVEPSIIRGLGNGSDELEAVLAPIHDHAGNRVGLLAPVAAASYEAMVAAAWADAVDLRPSSEADTFRRLAIQKSIFADRYRTTDQGNGSRVCAGRRWYLRQGKATAACPGTSNHGKGSAVDFDLHHPGVLAWLEQHAARFGWAWEIASEDWHLHYMLGDLLPAVVPKSTSEEDDLMIQIEWFKGEPTAPGDQPDLTAAYRVVYAQLTNGHKTAFEAFHVKSPTELKTLTGHGYKDLGAAKARGVATVAPFIKFHDGPFRNV